MHAKVTEFANLLHYEFVGTTTRDPASLSNRLYPAEAGKKLMVFAIHVTQCHLKYFLKRSSSRKKMCETAAIPINSYEMPCTKTSLCTVIAAQ